MKPALYYAVQLEYNRTRVIAVTSEKRRQWFGRDTFDDSATHGRMGDNLKGLFNTKEEAESIVKECEEVKAHFSHEREKVEEASRMLYRRCDVILEQIVKRQSRDRLLIAAVEVKQVFTA